MIFGVSPALLDGEKVYFPDTLIKIVSFMMTDGSLLIIVSNALVMTTQ